MNTPIGLYRPGNSVLHRLPAGPKLAALVVGGAASILVRTPAQTAAAMTLVLLGYGGARFSPRVLWEVVRPLLWVVVPLAVVQILVVGWERALVILGVMVTLVLLASLVTLTTRTTDLVDVVVHQSQHLRFLGVNPERMGLMLNLAIRAVHLVVQLGTEVREAQQARVQAASARAFAVPLIIGALRRADQLGDALAARGFDD